MHVVETRDLTKTYMSYKKTEGLGGSLRGMFRREFIEKTALLETNLQFSRGQLIGLVGANGAGKTTLIKLLSGLVHPSSGAVRVLGYEPWRRSYEFLRRMSVLLGQKNQLWWDISALDSFLLLNEIYSLEKAKTLDRVEELANLLNCQHVLRVQLRRLSLGERMKMELIGALLHQPEILFLDEPTIGLDIVAQTSIRDFLKAYMKTHNPTILLTSHYMDDIAKLADRLLLMTHGQIVYDGSVRDFVQKSSPLQKLSFSFPNPLTQSWTVLEHKLAIGQQEFHLSIEQAQVASILPKVLALPNVQNIQLNEADFEESIRQFLQAEPSVCKTSRTN
ncbi:MAG: ATP-binding cassette domain-containing protein [Bdellovibrio sp.]